MRKHKWLSIALAVGLTTSSLLAFGTVNQASAQPKEPDWNVQRYGNIKDIGPKLRKQAENETFVNNLTDQLKKKAEKLNLEEQTTEEKSSKSNDNSNGENQVEKYFVSYDLQAAGGYALEKYTKLAVGENVEVWVADDLSYPDDRESAKVNQEQIDHLIDEFDNNIYPKETEFFGSPDKLTGDKANLDDQLGLPEDYYTSQDGSHRVMLLVDNFKDEAYYDSTYPFYVAGFYSSLYEQYFNRNIINVDTNSLTKNTNGHFGTTAHEFQHLIHDDNDSDEATFINEGMSDFAEYLVYNEHPMGHVNFFLDHPENSLVKWDEYYNAETGPETLGDYGQAYLLQLYLYDQFGQAFIRDLATNQANGIAGIEATLEQYGSDLSFEELYRNFNIALHLDSSEPGDGAYNFKSIDLNVNYDAAQSTDKAGVPAWGVDFIDLDDSGKKHDVNFEGIQYLPVPWETTKNPLNGDDSVYYSTKGDLADNQLIFPVDLSGLDQATLKFDTLYNIEKNWDYGAVQVSTDDGQTWESLSNADTTSSLTSDGHPNIKANLPGFTGSTDGWTNEQFDLSKYAGQKVLVSFRYMTDWATNYDGWYIDDISIPEANVSYEGNNLDPFQSIQEIKNRKVNYAVTFINENKHGKKTKYKVRNIDPFSVNEEVKRLKGLHPNGDNYMLVSYVPENGDYGVVDYSYDLDKPGKGPKAGHGNPGKGYKGPKPPKNHPGHVKTDNPNGPDTIVH
ncbi:choice-of-anchor J domain-containing protein [Tuberibacillus sp. Marseille-P3662]|uniref:choice-of-anchor J domain-containing protein n=1 Tax=Tuberibacillus sp. Marseille-P3662 TaxID=1965358 RepID=UPI001593FB93|nr:choice-of-anchor J domain-containing protein [Tuberibacillus sp. Marseille-P3662]